MSFSLGTRCASCEDGFSGDEQVFTLPHAWQEYLQEERSYGWISGDLTIRLCGDCLETYRELRRECARMPESTASATGPCARVRATLDALPLETLRDERL